LQQRNYLGIYLAKDHATAVCIEITDGKRNVVACFNVLLEQAELSDMQVLARKIAGACAEKQLKFAETAVAMDCAMFMQHSVHSEFSDVKKITQTIRFDTEEALGTDATDVAIAFKIDSVDEHGSNLSVFTAQKDMLHDLLLALSANNLDPFSVEPDVNCLARFLCQAVSMPAETHPLFAMLSKKNGYFVTPLKLPWHNEIPTPPAAMRTFLISSSQNRTDLLTKQVSMTTALLQNAGAINNLEIIDATGSVNFQAVAAKLAIQTQPLDVTGVITGPTDGLDMVECAIACGAALVHLDSAAVNWRNDYMPYQGRSLRLQNTVKFFSAAAVILLFALGLYGLMQALQINRYHAQLREKFAKEYSGAMLGQEPPAKSKEAVTRIGTALRRTKDAQKGGFSLTGQEAIAAKLTLILQAFNKCAAATSLHIEQVNITDKAINISGDTSSRDNTLKVFEALRQTGLNIQTQSLNSQGGRDTFNVSVEPQKQPKEKEGA